MFEHFHPRHIPALVVAAGVTFGGTMPLFNAEKAITAFGLPNRIATSKPAQSLMVCSSARHTAAGMALFALYVGQNLKAVDIVVASLGYAGLVDGYVFWKEGVKDKAVFRAAFGAAQVLWGLFGMTAGYD